MLIYVDDIIIIAKNVQIMEDTVSRLNKVFDVKELGQTKLFLGIELKRNQEVTV
jgi:hypothetical protein